MGSSHSQPSAPPPPPPPKVVFHNLSDGGWLQEDRTKWKHPNEHYNDPEYWYYKVKCNDNKSQYLPAKCPDGTAEQIGTETSVDNLPSKISSLIKTRFESLNSTCSKITGPNHSLTVLGCAPSNPTNTGSANLADCCMNNDLSTQKSCPEGFYPDSTMCKKFMEKNCSTDHTKDTKEQCLEWCKTNKCNTGTINNKLIIFFILFIVLVCIIYSVYALSHSPVKSHSSDTQT